LSADPLKPPRLFTFIVFVIFLIAAILPLVHVLTVPLWQGEAVNVFDMRHFSLAGNSLVLASGTTFASLLIGISVSILLVRTDMRAKKIMLPFFILPILIPPHIHAIVWNQVNTFIPFDIHTLGGAVFILTLALYPFVILLTISGLNSIDKSLEEYSLITHGKWETITHVSIPLVFPHIFSGAVFVFIFSIIDFGVPDILRVNVWPVEIFIQFSAFYNDKAALILSFPLMALTGILVILQKIYMGKRTYIQNFTNVSENLCYSLGKWQIPAILFCMTIIFLSAILPLIILIINAGHPVNYINAIKGSAEQILFTFVISFLSTLIIVAFGFSVSYLIERMKNPLKYVFDAGSFLLLSVPAITMGITLIKIWNRPETDIIYSSSVIIILGHMARFLPFSVIPISSGIKQLNPRMEEAALMAGGKWLKMMNKIVIPLSIPSMTAAFFMVFILCFGEMGTTLLIIPPGKETISIKIYNLMHYGAYETVNALSLILIGIIFGVFGIFLFLLNKKS